MSLEGYGRCERVLIPLSVELNHMLRGRIAGLEREGGYKNEETALQGSNCNCYSISNS